MYELTTRGIKISVSTRFEKLVILKEKKQHVFSYEVTIQNLGDETVQLISRKWFIQDARGSIKVVEGPGVIGQQPVIKPGGQHAYNSWCPLSTEIGKMYGHFNMKVLETEEMFEAKVPHFQFYTNFVLN